MKLSEILIRFLAQGFPESEADQQKRVFLFNLINYFVLAFLLITGILYVYKGEMTKSYGLIGFFLVICIITLLFPATKNYERSSLILSVTLGFLFLYLLYFKQFYSDSWLVLLLYPVFISILVQNKNGFLISGIFLLLSVPIIFTSSLSGTEGLNLPDFLLFASSIS